MLHKIKMFMDVMALGGALGIVVLVAAIVTA